MTVFIFRINAIKDIISLKLQFINFDTDFIGLARNILRHEKFTSILTKEQRRHTLWHLFSYINVFAQMAGIEVRNIRSFA